MSIKRMNNHGFSMTEALVAAMVFSIGVLGVFATMSSQKAPTAEADRKVQAALVAKQYLETLRSKVDANDYKNNTGDLSIGNHTVNVNGYVINYTVTAAGGTPPYTTRKVDLTITW